MTGHSVKKQRLKRMTKNELVDLIIAMQEAQKREHMRWERERTELRKQIDDANQAKDADVCEMTHCGDCEDVMDLESVDGDFCGYDGFVLRKLPEGEDLIPEWCPRRKTATPPAPVEEKYNLDVRDVKLAIMHFLDQNPNCIPTAVVLCDEQYHRISEEVTEYLTKVEITLQKEWPCSDRIGMKGIKVIGRQRWTAAVDSTGTLSHSYWRVGHGDQSE